MYDLDEVLNQLDDALDLMETVERGLRRLGHGKEAAEIQKAIDIANSVEL